MDDADKEERVVKVEAENDVDEAEAEEERGGCSLLEHPRLELKGEGPHPLALKGFCIVGRNEAYRVPVGRREQATVVPRDGVKMVAATQFFKALAPRPFLFHLEFNFNISGLIKIVDLLK